MACQSPVDDLENANLDDRPPPLGAGSRGLKNDHSRALTWIGRMNTAFGGPPFGRSRPIARRSWPAADRLDGKLSAGTKR